ncbi:hypothetical protein ES703_120492 [subsurface metagenome]
MLIKKKISEAKTKIPEEKRNVGKIIIAIRVKVRIPAKMKNRGLAPSLSIIKPLTRAMKMAPRLPETVKRMMLLSVC